MEHALLRPRDGSVVDPRPIGSAASLLHAASRVRSARCASAGVGLGREACGSGEGGAVRGPGRADHVPYAHVHAPGRVRAPYNKYCFSGPSFIISN